MAEFEINTLLKTECYKKGLLDLNKRDIYIYIYVCVN